MTVNTCKIKAKVDIKNGKLIQEKQHIYQVASILE